MSPFDYLLLGHLIGDYALQTSWMASKKASNWPAILTHCLTYTLAVALVAYLGFGGLPPLALALIYLFHVFMDRRFFVQWWLKTIMSTTGPEARWLGIVVDQVFHLIILALALQL